MVGRVAAGESGALYRRARLLARQPADRAYRPAAVLAVALSMRDLGLPLEDQLIVDVAAMARTAHGFRTVLATILAGSYPQLPDLLLELTRKTPPAAVATVASLAGIAQCLAGDRAVARAALQRSLAHDPTAVIATTTQQMLDRGASTTDLRSWLASTLAPPGP